MMEFDIKTYFETIMSSSNDAIIIKDMNFSVKYWSKGATVIYGYLAQEIVDKPIKLLIPKETKDELLYIESNIINNQPIKNFITKRQTKDGRIIDISLTVVPVYNNENKLIGAVSIGRDITEQLKLEEKLQKKKAAINFIAKKLQLHKKLFLYANNGFIVTDSQGSILDANKAFLASCGYILNEIQGKNIKFFKTKRHNAQFYDDMIDKLKKVGNWKGEIWNKRRNGTFYLEAVTIGVIRNKIDDEIEYYYAITNDLTERLKYESELYHQAYHDALTGLPNRRFYYEYLKKALMRAKVENKMLATFFLDVDNFKNVNDSLGHDVGDILLQKVSERLAHTIRKNDIVARMGGDEFTLIIEDVADTDAVITVANKIIDIIQKPYYLVEKTILVTCSIGISIYPYNGSDIMELTKSADVALYRAKNAGKNRYCIYRDE